MEDQGKSVTEKGMAAVALHEHAQDIEKIIKGNFSLKVLHCRQYEYTVLCMDTSA